MPARRAMLPPDGARALSRTRMRDALLAALLCGTVRGDDACSSGVCVVAPLVALTGKRCSSAPTSVHLYELHSTWRRHAAPPSCHPTLCLRASEPLSRCASAPPLAGMRAELSLSLPPLTPQGRTWPVNATVTVTDCSGGSGAHVLAQLNISLWSGDAPADGGRGLLQQHRIPVRCRPCSYPQGRVVISAGEGVRAGVLCETRYA